MPREAVFNIQIPASLLTRKLNRPRNNHSLAIEIVQKTIAGVNKT